MKRFWMKNEQVGDDTHESADKARFILGNSEERSEKIKKP